MQWAMLVNTILSIAVQLRRNAVGATGGCTMIPRELSVSHSYPPAVVCGFFL
jgi:hypothetical protein